MPTPEISAIVKDISARVAAYPDRPPRPQPPRFSPSEIDWPELRERLDEFASIPRTFEGQVQRFVAKVSRRQMDLSDVPADMRGWVAARVPRATSRPKPAPNDPDWL